MARKPSFATICLHGGKRKGQRSHNTPIEMSASWELRSVKDLEDGFEGKLPIYGRLTPSETVQYVERKICAMETLDLAGGGAQARLRSDGMNAVSMVFHGAMRSGDHAIVIGPVYGGTYDLIRIMERNGFRFTFLAAQDPDLASKVGDAVEPRTRLIWGEMSTNPTITLWDVPDIVRVARSGASRPLVAVDTSFLSPYNFRPFEWGADVVVHSATKYLGAHGAFTAGLTVVARQTLQQHPDFWRNATEWANFNGGTPGDMEAWLLGIFMETLHLRVPRQNQNAARIARFLQEHPNILEVRYPGLEDRAHQYALARALLGIDSDHARGFGGMVAFRVKGGIDAVRRLLYSLNEKTVIKHKPSLGYTKTIVESPWELSQMSMTEEHRKLFGITEDLVRLSCGVEDTRTLIEALERSLDKI